VLIFRKAQFTPLLGIVILSVLYAQGPAASLSELWVSAKRAPAPTTAEDKGVVEERSASLPRGAIVEPAEVQVDVPLWKSAVGNTEEGPITPPHVVVSGPVADPTIVLPQAPIPRPTEERVVAPPPSPVAGRWGLRSQKPRPIVMPRSG
jgi:hypothetical protein